MSSHMTTAIRRSLLAACVLATAVRVGAGVFPEPVGKVNDFAGLLTADDRTALEAQLADLERATSAEVAVVTVTSTNGRPIEDYAAALFAEWGIGKKDADNGVLVLVASADRAMRIEVGYGLEGILPDGLAGAVIRETFLPNFRKDDYRRGIIDGTARVADIIRRHETLTDAQRAALDREAAEAAKDWRMGLFFGLFVAAGAFVAGTAVATKVALEVVFGVVFMGAPLYFAQYVAPQWSVALLFVVAVLVLYIGYRIGRRPSWRRFARGSGSNSGWVISSPPSGSSSGGGSSSGSSFGGGSSGGGGASGRW